MGVHTTDVEAAEASSDLLAFLADLIAAREPEPTDDLVGRLAQRVADGELGRVEAASMALLLLFAGHETTANMTALGALVLLENPDLAERIRSADPPGVTAAVEELLRVLTVAHLGRRRLAVADVDFGGVHIKAGEGVIVASELNNRDPAKFPDPDALIFDRPGNQHMAFGFGAHQCLGQSLARMELQVAYPALFRRFPGLRVAVPPDQLRFREAAVVYGLHDLPVAW
jgi:cytochrome P450